MTIIRDDFGNPLITLKRYINPDFILSTQTKQYDNSYSYANEYFCIHEKLLVIEEADEEFFPKAYGSVEVMAIKIEDNRILFLDKKHGWTPHSKATDKYFELIAEKELVEG